MLPLLTQKGTKHKLEETINTLWRLFQTVISSVCLVLHFHFGFNLFCPFGVRRDLWQRRSKQTRGTVGCEAASHHLIPRATLHVHIYNQHPFFQHQQHNHNTGTPLGSAKAFCQPQNPNLVSNWRSWGRVSSIRWGKLLSVFDVFGFLSYRGSGLWVEFRISNTPM